ncbi:MAG: tetratricopeptide repeat protein [Candidatus Omnitrophica bacterium]|nr:tetratricopeptide repeat protein [Candidatus Omnitrophota bacterium]
MIWLPCLVLLLTPKDQLDAALEAVRLGRLAEGEQILKDLSRAAPDFHDSWGHLAHLLVQQGRIEEAVLCYQKVLEIKPGLPEAVLLLGDAFYSLGQHDRAYRTYLQLKGQPVFESKDLQIRLARCEPAWRLFLQRGLRKLPELGRVLVSPGFYCALGRELWLLPRSGSAIRLVGLKAYLAFLYHSLVREKTWHFLSSTAIYAEEIGSKFSSFTAEPKWFGVSPAAWKQPNANPLKGRMSFRAFSNAKKLLWGLRKNGATRH